MHIAILEDNPDIVAYMQIALELAGHHVSSHTHATSLLDTLFTASGPRSPLPYDLITIDLLLPEGFSGLNVIERIREGIPPTQLPIIVISGAGPDLRASTQGLSAGDCPEQTLSDEGALTVDPERRTGEINVRLHPFLEKKGKSVRQVLSDQNWKFCMKEQNECIC